MVLVGTRLHVSDNSGARKVKCINVLGCTTCNDTNIGDRLVVSIIEAKVDSKVNLHGVYTTLLVRQKKKTFRKSGLSIAFFKNSVVLINKKNEPLGTRVHGSVLQELRYKNCMKIMLLALNIV